MTESLSRRILAAGSSRALTVLAMLAALGSPPGGPTCGWAAELDFESDIAPLIAGRCLECHNSRDERGGLDLSTAEGTMRGGDSGPAIDLQDPTQSLLLQRIQAGEMPPSSSGGESRSLAPEEIARLQAWIGEGAKWPADRRLDPYERTSSTRAGRDWWSLQPLVRPEIPAIEVPPEALEGNAIDRFVIARLAAHDLQMAPPADRRVLARCAFFDLWGLPPTPEQIDRFVADNRPDAWPRLLDTLLASPHYGERWARHWLDVVRFAETCGYERDQLKPGIWKYRDWVIDALNSDMPYDQFVTWQLAGDEIPDRTEDSVIATGMLRAGTWNDEPNDPADYLYERLEDMIHVTSSAFVGLTVKCARCHDHKFDPIPQTDYYRIAGSFWAGYLGQANLGGPSAEQLGFDVFGWTDRSPAVEPLHLLVQGDRHQPRSVVPPGFLSAVAELDRPLDPPPEGAKTTHRRLNLARWIVDARHPLTARVMVNRLWLHHFGEGLVRTPDNFGFKGDPPTHPDLLDWLAAEFMQPRTAHSDPSQPSPVPWSLKRMHKLIMMSACYRQASTHPCEADYVQRDASNRLLWRFNRQRLDAESLRDAMLSCSGELNPKMGGPSFYPQMSAEALEGLSRKSNAWQDSPADERRRRSIYMMTMRSRILPLMTAFDFCDTTRPCGQRDVTTVPTQALALLNNQLVHDQSRALARRLQLESPANTKGQIVLAWRRCLGARTRRRGDCRGTAAPRCPGSSLPAATSSTRVGTRAGGPRAGRGSGILSPRIALPCAAEYERVLVCGLTYLGKGDVPLLSMRQDAS